jgi:Fe-S-cluster containining protein
MSGMIRAMKLQVMPSDPPWYGGGLKFKCTQCGNCCTGGPGFVWISDEEIHRLAEFLKLTQEQVRLKYCRKVGGRWSLKERRTPQGNYDCVFLTEIPAARGGNKDLPAGAQAPLARRGCSIYAVRPLQCRTWPFWHSNLDEPDSWARAGEKCPGLNGGTRTFSVEEIEALRDAADWPEDPPSSKY